MARKRNFKGELISYFCEKIPREIIYKILQYLEPNELVRAQLVSTFVLFLKIRFLYVINKFHFINRFVKNSTFWLMTFWKVTDF